ncbi:MAG: hypothetical protein ACYTGV_06075 [Planctomycetota bacterium]|jgi:hypothetical protein
MTADTLSILALVLHFAATFYMVGLVWFVQRVHYPLFAGVGSQQFPAYARAHVSRTSPVVGPPMLIETATALALIALPMQNVPHPLPWLGLSLLVVIWLSTALLQVPRHRELSAGFETSAHRRLVATNWIRTSAWSLRGLLVLWMVACAWAGAST